MHLVAIGAGFEVSERPSCEIAKGRKVEVFREVRRVRRPDGVCWFNMGDNYAEKTKAKTMYQADADFQ